MQYVNQNILKLVLVWDFQQLSRIINKVLSERLHQLEREKIEIKTKTKNDESNDILYSLTPLALEFHETLQDIEYWIDKWKDYKRKEQEEKSNLDNWWFLWVVKIILTLYQK